jgi:GR25 family glycosyltransferase involved in LPS biosynthesis
MSAFNKYFDKIFVINLFDRKDKFDKVKKQFNNRKIKVERFIAVDGRCINQGIDACMEKLKTFEIAYDVKIDIPRNKEKLKVLMPASSLTIGTVLILREMVKQKLKKILICEDDVELSRNLENKFKQGLKQIGNKNWDLLYLGCGSYCGNNGISYKKSNKTKHLSHLSNIYSDSEDVYVENKNDLRSAPCEDDCRRLSKNISYPLKPGGTWAYAYSLAGAKKLLKIIDNNVAEHIDQIIIKNVENKKLKALAFDPPIIYHEKLDRTVTTIPWKF